MNRLKSLLLIFILFQMVCIAQAAPPVVYVAGDGSGDFNCDGVSDQIEINEALDFVATHDSYTTVHLKGNHIYWIDDTIEIPANTILEGDDDAVIKLIDHANWNQKFKPLIAQKGYQPASILGEPNTHTGNITIRGFEIDGNRENQNEPSGKSYYTLIQLQNCYNVEINDMYLHNNLNDAVRLINDTVGEAVNSTFHDNRIQASGHDGFYIINANQFEVKNNYITNNRVNSGIRTTRCNHLVIKDNVIGNDYSKTPSGGAAIQIQTSAGTPINDVKIQDNYLYGYFTEYGIWLDSPVTDETPEIHRDIRIYHNIIRAFTKAGIGIEGFQNTLIENNTIDGNGAGISFVGTPENTNSGFTTIVRNNIITGSKNGGYGLDNHCPDTHTFISDYNDIYGNAGGHYYNASSETDIHVNPLYVKSGGAISQPGWHLVVATYDSTTEIAEIYVDGEKTASKKMIGFGNISLKNKSLYLGSYRGSAYGLHGSLDDVAVWHRALNNAEISSLWNNGNGISITGSLTSGIDAYWKMDGSWTDSSVNGYNATYSSAEFTEDAHSGTHAGTFNGSNFTMYPSSVFSPSTAVTIAAWVKRDDLNGYGTILNKGSQGSNRHIWLYVKDDKVYFEFGNGSERKSVNSGVNPLNLDFHVRSEYGRFQGGEWVFDSITSPCIDSGDPSSDYSAESSPNGERINIGAYGNTPEASKSFSQPNTGSRIYEDAEDGTENGWDVYDSDPPIEATISNVYDDVRGSRVIELSGSGMSNGYRLRNDNGEYWNETELKVIQFSMRFNEDFTVLIPVMTKNGFRYMVYTTIQSPGAENNNDSVSIYNIFDNKFSDGNWHTIVLNLEKDLEAVQPGNDIESVWGFLVRGSGRVDDIIGLNDIPQEQDSDEDGITDVNESLLFGTSPYQADSDNDGLSDGEEQNYWNQNWNADYDGDGLVNIIDEDSDDDGYNDGFEVEQGTNPSDSESRPNLVYEDAEVGLTSGWNVCDDDSGSSATITNVYDALRNSSVIALNGSGMSSKYCLGNDSGEYWHETRSNVLQWSMLYNEDFSVFIPVMTKNGFRYMIYTASSSDNLGTGIVIHHGIGENITDGNWHTINRDLEQDLKEAQPDNELLEVLGFSIRGSGMVDDILLQGSE